MTTARRPPSPPKPKLTRAPAKPIPESKNPITTEIMQRIRRVIAKSDGQITTATLVKDLDVNQSVLREWLSCYRAMPGADNLMKLVRWLANHDNGLVIIEVIAPRKIRFRGDVEDLRLIKLTDSQIADIQSSSQSNRSLAALYKVDRKSIAEIKSKVPPPSRCEPRSISDSPHRT